MNAISDARYKALADYNARLKEYHCQRLSEADTRAKCIDVFLRDILGWDEPQLRRERTWWEDDTRAAIDYEVGKPKPLFIVEAKKLPSEFELPDHTGRHLYKLDGAIESCPTLWAAICQVRAYCDRTGIPFAVVTNGSHFALFRAISINRSWREGVAYVFSSQSMLSKHFCPLHDALAFEVASMARIDNLLDQVTAAQKPWRLSDLIGPQVGRLSNTMNDIMEQTIGIVLRDQAEPTREFLEACYSVDPTVDHYAKALQGLLKDPVPIFSASVQSTKPGHKKDPFGRALTALVDRQGIKPPIVLIGGKGFGKTTFLQWFMRASAFREELKGDVLLWVDFRTVGYSAAEVASQVRKALIEQLENSSSLGVSTFGALKEVYRERLDKERKRFLAPFSADKPLLEQKMAELVQEWRNDHASHLLALVTYAVSHCNKRVVIVLDNSDQKKTEFQMAAYDTAQQFALSLPSTVIVSLRESTYYKLCKVPQGDAFSQQQVFHIRAPSLSSVLRQRFEYLTKELGSKKTALKSMSGIDLTIGNVATFVGLLHRSLLNGKDSAQIQDLLAALSNGSVREGLNMLHEFLVSGHTKMEDYFWNYAINVNSTIPYHEFLASVMLDEMAYFREDYSQTFINIFGRTAAAGDSHFTRLRILRLIRELSPGNEFRPEDYVSVDEVRNGMRLVGVPDAAIDSHMQTLLRFGLLQADTQTSLEDSSHLSDEYGEVRAVHIGAAGQYYSDVLSGHFQYLQRLLTDISIYDDDARNKLSSLYAPYKTKNFLVPVERAVQGVEILMDYLSQQEDKENSSGILARHPALSAIRFVPDIRSKLTPQIFVIRQWREKIRHE